MNEAEIRKIIEASPLAARADEVGGMWGDTGRIYSWGKRKGRITRALTRDRTVAPLDRYFSALFAEEEFY